MHQDSSWTWNVRITPLQSEDELDQMTYDYLSENALASNDERERLAQVFDQYETERPFPGMPPPANKCTEKEAATVYSVETEKELIDISRRIALDDLEDRKLSHHESLWPELEELSLEEHEKRADRISFYFHQKRTGRAF